MVTLPPQAERSETQPTDYLAASQLLAIKSQERIDAIRAERAEREVRNDG